MKKLFIIFILSATFFPIFASAVIIASPLAAEGPTTPQPCISGYFSPSSDYRNNDCTKIPICPPNSTSTENFNYTTQKYQYTCPCNNGYQFNSATTLCDLVSITQPTTSQPQTSTIPTTSVSQTTQQDNPQLIQYLLQVIAKLTAQINAILASRK